MINCKGQHPLEIVWTNSEIRILKLKIKNILQNLVHVIYEGGFNRIHFILVHNVTSWSCSS